MPLWRMLKENPDRDAAYGVSVLKMIIRITFDVLIVSYFYCQAKTSFGQ